MAAQWRTQMATITDHEGREACDTALDFVKRFT
jgi:hypothetical protein